MQKSFVKLRQMSQDGSFIQNVYVRPEDIVCIFEQPEQVPGTSKIKLSYSALVRARVRTPDGSSANVHLILEQNPLEPSTNNGYILDVRKLGVESDEVTD